MATKKEKEEAAKRSAAAKKAAETRKRNAEAEQETQQEVQQAGPSGEPAEGMMYTPRHRPLKNAGFDHHAAEKQRQAELDAEREMHNRRTAGQAA